MKKILPLLLITALCSLSDAVYAQPANDDCAGAVVLIPQAGALGSCTGSATSYVTENATPSAPPSGDFFGKDDDVWFSFTTSATVGQAYGVTLSNKATSAGPGGMSTIELWSDADCNNPSGQSLSFHPYSTSVSFGLLSVNTTYKVRVYTPGTSNRLTAFNICINSFNAPAPNNDTYFGTFDLTFDTYTSCANALLNQHTVNATAESPAACAGAATTPPNDVWYRFNAVNAAAIIQLQNIMQVNGTSNTMWMQLLQGSNTGPVLACSNTNTLSTASAGVTLTIGATYYLRVYNNDAASSCVFDICAKTPPGPSFSNCDNAINIIPSSTENCGNVVSINNSGISGTETSGCSGTNYNNVWLKFIAPANSTTYELNISNYQSISGNSNPLLYYTIYSGSCGALTQVSCAGNPFPSLTAGETYYLRIGTYNNIDQGQFDVCIKKQIATPVNIDCASAATLTATTDLSAAYTNGTTQGVTQAMTTACYGGNAPNKLVWYKFVATASSHFIEFTDIVRLGLNQNSLGYKVYSGTCAALTSLSPDVCVALIRDNNQTVNGLTIGQTYFIQVMENTYNGGPVSFKIRVRGTGVSNDEPANAIQLTQNPTSTNATAATLKYASVTLFPAPPPSVTPTPTQDVWFKFTAASSTVDFTVSGTIATYHKIIYQNDLSTEVYSGISNNVAINGLTAGNNYYIRIINTNTASLGTYADFNICVAGVPNTEVANSPTPASCATIDGPATSTNSNTWLHLTHEGKLLASVFDGSNMGIINGGYFINTSSVRSGTDGTEYLDRNFSINPTQQPTNPVKVRLYFAKAEFDALVDANDGDGNDVYYLNDLKITKFSSVPCNTTISNNPSSTISVDAYGSLTSSVYWVEFTVPSFSSFYIQNNQVVLPIACGGFNYKLDGEKVVFTWSTLSESNSSHFDIEKSTDAVNFEKAGTIKAAGNSSTTLQYSFTDKNLPVKTTYYRLKQTDKNGDYKYDCGILKVNAKSKNSFGTVYPNPVKNMLTINIEKAIAGKINVQIVNTMGQPVMQYQQIISTSDSQLKVSTGKLAKGSYVLKITTDKEAFTQTFIKD